MRFFGRSFNTIVSWSAGKKVRGSYGSGTLKGFWGFKTFQSQKKPLEVFETDKNCLEVLQKSEMSHSKITTKIVLKIPLDS